MSRTICLIFLNRWACLAVLLGLALPYLPPAWDLHTFGSFQNNVSIGYTNAAGKIDVRGQLAGTQRLYYEEGRSATASVIESQQFRAVVINGRSVATDHHSDLHHEYLLGHLPMLLHPAPRDVLVIAFGGGITLSTVELYGPRSLDCVELAPGVFRAASYFDEYNLGLAARLAEPPLRLIVDDGRNHVLRASERYDVIISDATHPATADSWLLYTREFYELSRKRLNDGGMVGSKVPR